MAHHQPAAGSLSSCARHRRRSSGDSVRVAIQDRGWLGRAWDVDPFSTGLAFPWWTERADHHVMRPPPGYDGLVVWLPKSWLLREGWRRRGATISRRDVPGPA